MIKIIKEGKRQVKECPNCGCIFSYENEDIKGYSSSSSKDGISISYYCSKEYIKCPQCNSEVIIDFKEKKY